MRIEEYTDRETPTSTLPCPHCRCYALGRDRFLGVNITNRHYCFACAKFCDKFGRKITRRSQYKTIEWTGEDYEEADF